MGYDLHLTRAADWLEAEQSPFGLDEWVAAARTTPALTEITELSTGDGVPVFLLGADAHTDPALYWQDGQVTIRGADESHVPALAAIASSLRLRLLGDDDEEYW